MGQAVNFQKLIGINSYPFKLKSLSIKFIIFSCITATINLSQAWIPIYYLKFMSFSDFGIIISVGLVLGIILDYPLGILTDKTGQKKSFIIALLFLSTYYWGLVFAFLPIHFLFLECIVGIYSALLSGTLSAWFMNQWDYLASKEHKNRFGSIMSNLNFMTTLVNAAIMFIGGLLFVNSPELSIQSDVVIYIFIFQGLAPIIGVFLALAWMNTPSLPKIAIENNTKKDITNNRVSIPNNDISKQSYNLIIIFVALGLLSFTEAAFSNIMISPFLNTLGTTIMIISIVRSLGIFMQSLSFRFSSEISNFIPNISKKGTVLISHLLTDSIAWLLLGLVSLMIFNSTAAVLLVIGIFLFRIILSGLTISLLLQIYYKITDPTKRTSQQSLHNTINMVFAIIGYIVMGEILELLSFGIGFLFLSIIGLIGIFLLYYEFKKINFLF